MELDLVVARVPERVVSRDGAREQSSVRKVAHRRALSHFPDRIRVERGGPVAVLCPWRSQFGLGGGHLPQHQRLLDGALRGLVPVLGRRGGSLRALAVFAVFTGALLALRGPVAGPVVYGGVGVWAFAADAVAQVHLAALFLRGIILIYECP